MSSSSAAYTLITGASSGIGRQTAWKLAASRSLILNGRDLPRLEETRQGCPDPERHLIWPFDLKVVDQLEKSLVELLDRGPVPVEAFVHCAGAVHVAPLRQWELPSMCELMNVNFLSAVEISRLLVTRKVNQKHLRRMVFVSSTASRFGARGFQMYCATKAALDGFMRAVATELAPDVRVNSVLPGAVETPMTQGLLGDPAVRERLAASYPLGIGQPGDIAGVIEFLLSENANWLTGQEIVVDGGRSINHSG